MINPIWALVAYFVMLAVIEVLKARQELRQWSKDFRAEPNLDE